MCTPQQCIGVYISQQCIGVYTPQQCIGVYTSQQCMCTYLNNNIMYWVLKVSSLSDMHIVQNVQVSVKSSNSQDIHLLFIYFVLILFTFWRQVCNARPVLDNLVGAGQMITFPLHVLTIQHCDVHCNAFNWTMCEYRYQILIGIHQCRCGVHSEAETFEYTLIGARQMVTYPLRVWTIQHCDVHCNAFNWTMCE